MNDEAPPPPIGTPREELINSLTHGLGMVLSAAGVAVLVTLATLRGDGWHVFGTAVFGGALLLLYTASTLYHSSRTVRVKRILRKFDHAAIFLVIAGTYTPFLLVNLRGPWGWTLFGVIWVFALIGIVLKFRFAGQYDLLSTGVYLGMGWLVLLAVRPLLAALPPIGFQLLLAGGLLYTGGTVFYLWEKLRYHHAVWHIFVLGGSICHFLAVLHAVVPPM